MDRKIEKALQEHKERVLKAGYSENEILGIFLYGSQNYGTDLKNSDVDTKCIIVPTYEDLCLKPPVSKELHLENGEHCEVKDIREIMKMFLKQNINFLEILFTEYCWVNPKYKEKWEDLLLMNHCIAHYDINRTVQSICGQAIHTLKQNPFDGKKISNGLRLYLFLEYYLALDPYQRCIKLDGMVVHLLKTVKSQKVFKNDVPAKKLISKFEKIKSVSYEEIFNKERKLDIERTLNQISLDCIRKNI